MNAFSAAFSWDFGLVTVQGLRSSLHVVDSVFANTKNVAVEPLLSGGMVQESHFRLQGGAIVGATDDDVCSVRSPHACSPVAVAALGTAACRSTGDVWQATPE